MNTTARNATLADLAAMLKDQQARKVDIVANATALRAEAGQLVVTGADVELTAEGVTTTDGWYQPTAVFDEGVADKLGIPLAYLRKLRTDRPDLYDANVNGWLHGYGADPESLDFPADGRRFLVRGFKGDDGPGIARALLSDTYRIVDHLDVLMAALAGVQASGVDIKVQGADLTDRRMHVRITAPAVQALAPDLLAGYRSPFTGAEGADNPTVFAGFHLGNSETGGGAFSITPRIVFQVCDNGATISRDVIRQTHLGGKLADGVVRYSDDTQQANLDLITKKARDAVATFLDVGYVRRAIEALSEQAGVKLPDPQASIEHVSKQLAFTDAEQAGILGHFIDGGQRTAGGLFQAVTSYAQLVEDGDRAAELEAAATRALDLAAASV